MRPPQHSSPALWVAGGPDLQMTSPQAYAGPCRTWNLDERLGTKLAQAKESSTISKEDLGRCLAAWQPGRSSPDPTTNHLQEKAAHLGRVRKHGTGEPARRLKPPWDPCDRRRELASASCPRISIYVLKLLPQGRSSVCKNGREVQGRQCQAWLQ